MQVGARPATMRFGIAAGAILAGSVLMVSLYWGLQHAAMTAPRLLGNPAPVLAIQTLDGRNIDVSQLRGRPVVVNFWASWCTTCVGEATVLSDASMAHPGVTFVGADMQDTVGGVKAFEQRHPHAYPVGPIVSGSYGAYGVAGLPVTFFIDAQGVVTASFAGPLDGPTLSHYLGLIGG